MNFGDLIAKGSAVFLKKKLSAMQAVFDAGTAPEKAAFQASVSKDPVPRVCRVIVVAGQSTSKAADVADPNIDVGYQDTYQYCCNASENSTYKSIISASLPLRFPEDVPNLLSFGQVFGRAYAGMTGCPVLVVPCSWGATAMVGSRWQPGNPGGDLYENMIARANEAVTAATEMFGAAQVDGVYWTQGEGDGDNGKTQAQYAPVFSDLINGVRSRITGAANSWFLVGSMPYETMQYYPETKPIYYAHRQVAASKTRCVFVQSPRGYTKSPGVDRHLNSKGTRIMARRMANAVPSAIAKTVADAAFVVPSAPGTASASSITNTSAALSWSAPSGSVDDYVVQLSTDNGTTWSTYARRFNDAPGEVLVGLVKNTSYKTRVAGTNPAGTGPYNTISSFQTANISSLIPYTFEADTAGAAPSAITLTTGAAVVVVASVYAEKMIHVSTPQSVSGVAWYGILDNVPNTGTDQTVIWHRRTTNGISHDRSGPVIRRQTAYTTGTYSGLQRGYFVNYDSPGATLSIYRFDGSGISSVSSGSAPAAASNADVWFKAVAVGSTLTAYYSTDGGTTWTQSCTGTDTTYPSGGVGFGSINYTSSDAWIGEINVTQ